MEPPEKKRKVSNNSKNHIPLYNSDKIFFEKDLIKCISRYQSKGLTDKIYSIINNSESSSEEAAKILPSCLRELKDNQAMLNLRTDFSKFCEDKIGLTYSPYEAFNRFLLKIFSIQSSELCFGIFPKYYSQKIHDSSRNVLFHEVLSEIPCRVRKKRFTSSLKELLWSTSSYFKKVTGLLEKHRKDKNAKWDEEIQKMKNDEVEGEGDEDNKENIEKQRTEFDERCQFIFKKIGILELELDNLSQYLENQKRSKQMKEKEFPVTRSVQEFYVKLFSPFDLTVRELFRKFVFDGLFSEYCGELFAKISSNVSINRTSNSNYEIVTVCNDMYDETIIHLHFRYSPAFPFLTSSDYIDSVQILRKHFEKLKFLYELHNKYDPEQKNFLRCLYCVIKRYNTLIGNHDSSQLFSPHSEGTNFHAAAPEGVFKFLEEKLDIGCELYASPFNCYFPRYCSVFGDTDVFFGSFGSADYFIQNLKFGNFEVGPPYTLEVQNDAARLILEKLENDKNENPLSFVMFVAEWRYPCANYHSLLESSGFLRTNFVLQGIQHYNVSGGQQFPFNEESLNEPQTVAIKRKYGAVRRYYPVPNETHVYFLQNERGREKYSLDNNQFKEDLTKAFRTWIDKVEALMGKIEKRDEDEDDDRKEEEEEDINFI